MKHIMGAYCRNPMNFEIWRIVLFFSNFFFFTKNHFNLFKNVMRKMLGKKIWTKKSFVQNLFKGLLTSIFCKYGGKKFGQKNLYKIFFRVQICIKSSSQIRCYLRGGRGGGGGLKNQSCSGWSETNFRYGIIEIWWNFGSGYKQSNKQGSVLT